MQLKLLVTTRNYHLEKTVFNAAETTGNNKQQVVYRIAFKKIER